MPAKPGKPATNAGRYRVGTAGWSIPRASAARCEPPGTHLERYARAVRCVEINSSFYRPHTAETYARWRDSTPADFRFAVKLPRTITHESKLKNAREPFAAFLAQTDGLADKRGPILVQLPPSFAFDEATVTKFLGVVRRAYKGGVVCEPRHATWFTPQAAATLERFRVSLVIADPPSVPEAGAGRPNARQLAYFRLHGSPRMYWSRYEEPYIAALAETIHDLPSDEVWCVFDNTATGSALENAWELNERLLAERPVKSTKPKSGPRYLIQILLPIPSTGGGPAFSRTREELADKFGGVTAYTRSPAQGIWISPEGEKERDSVLMVEVFTDEFDRTWWRNYERRLAERFNQDEIHLRAVPAEVP